MIHYNTPFSPIIPPFDNSKGGLFLGSLSIEVFLFKQWATGDEAVL